MSLSNLEIVARYLAAPGKGILAADESTGTIGKRLEKMGLKNDEETRRSYRELLLTSAIGGSISGVILFKETLYQSTESGKAFVKCLVDQGVYPGIKVDEGLQPLDGGLEGETWTKGLENLAAMCAEYAKVGAKFAKWRATIKIQPGGPSEKAILQNADELAQYAKICQGAGLVPIVEPEILIDGDHTIGRSQEVTEKVLAATMAALWRHGVQLEACLLKPQMVLPGAECSDPKPSAEVIAKHTLTALRRTIPPALPGVMFLSGGQTEEEATVNLDAINRMARMTEPGCPWSLSFSFGRALQHSVLKLWSSDQSKGLDVQQLLMSVARANGLASRGQYTGPHPTSAEGSASLYEGFRGWRADQITS